ncbi:MAG: ThiF family adenylyltransferase [Nesterenkonia sp.]
MSQLSKFSRSQAERFQRHFALAGFGIDAQAKLLDARVVVVGAGGLGAPILTYLAAAGVGQIDIIDHDVVERSNLHRQVIHSEDTLDQSKATSAAEAMRGLHPEVVIREHRKSITADNALQLIEPGDVVVDGTDNFVTRYVVSDACEIAGKPLISGSILRFAGQVSMFWSAPDDRHWNPAWQAAGRGPTYRDLYPEAPDAGEVPTCAEAGVIGVLPGVIGSLMAAETIKFLAEVGEPLLGRVINYDALTSSFTELRLAPDPDREPVRSIGADVQGLGGGPETASADAAPDDGAAPVPPVAPIPPVAPAPATPATPTPDPHSSQRSEGTAPPQAVQSENGWEDRSSGDRSGQAPDEAAGAQAAEPADSGAAPDDIDFNPFTGDPKQADDLSPAELRRAVAEGRLAGILDVREPREHAGGSIESAVNIPLMDLWHSEEPPPGLEAASDEKPVVVYCAHGVRSRQALQLLNQRYPEAPVKNLLGGYELWRSS